MEGRLALWEFHSGLTVHATDLIEVDDLETRVELRARVSVLMLLEGAIDANIDEQPIALDAGSGPAGALWWTARDATLVRRSKPGRRVRKVVVSVPPTWFDELFHTDPADPSRSRIASALTGEMTARQWRPSLAATTAAEEIVGTTGANPGMLDRIQVEICAMQLLREAIDRAVPTEDGEAHDSLDPRDVGRARGARDFIRAHWHEDLALPDVARRTGMSVTTLQRVFRACFDMTAMEFLRAERLEHARQGLISDGLTVGAAARLASYSSTANFATAFRRRYGYPPSSLRRGTRADHDETDA